jgi:hypothetical protein
MWADHLAKCENPGKVPVLKKWQTRGVPTGEEVDAWKEKLPAGNIGLVLGAASGLIGLDIDGEAGEALLAEWSSGDVPDTWEFKTGGGRRLLYRIPSGLILKKAKEQKEGEHEELALLGQGQQTVIPPSIHSTGIAYAWAPGRDPFTFGDAAIAPGWVIGRMQEKEKTGTTATTSRRGDACPEILSLALEKAKATGRNDTGIWLACQLRDEGISRGEADGWMRKYVEGVGPGKHPYTWDEASHSLDQAFSKTARKPWRATVLRIPDKGDEEELPSIKPLRKIGSDPPVYIAQVNGVDLRLSLDELITFRLFKRKCQADLSMLPFLPRRRDAEGKVYPSQTVWEMVVNEANAEIIHEAAPPEDASKRGAAWDAVCAFLTESVLGQERKDILRGSVLIEEGHYLFRSRDLRRYLKMHKADTLEEHELWLLLKDKDGSSAVLKVARENKRVWRIPAQAVTGSNDAGPAEPILAEEESEFPEPPRGLLE